MRKRVTVFIAVLLIALGVGCILYAISSLRELEATPPAGPHRVPPAGLPAPGEEGDADEIDLRRDLPDAPPRAPATGENAPAPGTQAAPAPRDPPEKVAAGPAIASDRTPPRTPDADRERARRDAARLWILVALPLVFVILMLAMMVFRRLRPRPMRRTGPSDTTDLWQEAGRRLK